MECSMSIRLAITGLTASLVLVACGGPTNDDRARPSSTPSAPPPPSQPAAQAEGAAKEPTPLSDLITLNIKAESKENIDRFGEAFMRARVAVILIAPKGASGTVQAGQGDTAVGQTKLPDGRKMI